MERKALTLFWSLTSVTLLFIHLTAQARAGILEELFGAGEREQAAPAHAPHSSAVPPPPADKSKLRPLPRKTSAAPSTATGTRPRKAAFCYSSDSQPRQGGYVDALIYDETLRSGDSVVTGDGVRIFEGTTSCPHRLDQFVALKYSRASRKKQSNLHEIEQGMILAREIQSSHGDNNQQ